MNDPAQTMSATSSAAGASGSSTPDMKTDAQTQPEASSARRRPVGAGLDTRELVLAWCLWLIGVWGLLLWTVGWVGPAYRWMTFAVMVGLMGLWPAARLSQDHFGRGSRGAVLLDWFCLNLVFQAVLWPMRLAAGWDVPQALWIMAAVASWSLLTGLIIAWGRSYGTAAMRTLAMLACAGVVVAEPLALAVGAVLRGAGGPGPAGVLVTDGWLELPNLRLSPVQAWWELTSPPALFVPQPWTDYVIGVGVAAVVGWCVLAVLMPRGGRK